MRIKVCSREGLLIGIIFERNLRPEIGRHQHTVGYCTTFESASQRARNTVDQVSQPVSATVSATQWTTVYRQKREKFSRPEKRFDKNRKLTGDTRCVVSADGAQLPTQQSNQEEFRRVRKRSRSVDGSPSIDKSTAVSFKPCDISECTANRASHSSEYCFNQPTTGKSNEDAYRNYFKREGRK